MAAYTANIETETLQNDNYRKVLHTGVHMQLVVMTLQPGEEIGMEVHAEHDQFFRVEQGVATALVAGQSYQINADEVLIVPAGAEHNIINAGDELLKLYTIYAPPEHPDGTLQATKPVD